MVEMPDAMEASPDRWFFVKTLQIYLSSSQNSIRPSEPLKPVYFIKLLRNKRLPAFNYKVGCKETAREDNQMLAS